MNLLEKYRQLKATRKDTEHVQAVIRIIIIFMVLLHSFWNHLAGHLSLTPTLVILPFQFFSLLILADIFRHPEINSRRRYVGVFADNIAATLLMWVASERASLFLFVYLWVAIGNGFRYGNRYLFLSAFLATVGYSSLLYFDPFWSQHRLFGSGILISVVAVTGYTAVLLKQLKDTRSELEKMATHDHLTGLANRNLLEEKLKQSLALNHRHDRDVGVVFFDLDGFKAVNDKFGHKCGDNLLIEVAAQVKECIRHSDTFARIGGDEFVIVLDSLRSFDEMKSVCERILKKVTGIRKVDGHEIEISSSIGVVLLQSATITTHVNVDKILRAADEQMYKAKRAGKSRIEYSVLSPESRQSA